MNYEERIYKYAPLWGEWNIDKLIGIGSYGKVYKISKQLGDENVISAVKHITIPTREQYEDAILSIGNNQENLNIYFKDIVKKFENEIRLLYKLRGNTNIVNYEDYMIKAREDIGWDIFIKMEYVTPLNKLIEAKDLTKEMILNLGIDICNGLKLCHDNGIIHRDIKDSNIFISSNNNFKIGDFGVAINLSSEEAMTKIGTPYYMAPEIILNHNHEGYDKTVDIYSLGIVLYRLFNKLKLPFVPLDEGQITFNIKEMAQAKRVSGKELPKPCNADENVWKIIKKACAYNPKERYSKVEELKLDLYDLLRCMSENEKEEVIIKATGISRNNPYFTYEEGEVVERNIERSNEDIILDLEEDTVLLDNDSTVLLENEEDTVLLDECNIEEIDNSNKIINRKKFLMYILLPIITLIVIGVPFVLKGEKNNLPEVSSELGSLPGNLSSYDGYRGVYPYIVTNDISAFNVEERDLEEFDIETSEFTKITEDDREPTSFNKYGDFIYYVRLDNNSVEKYNTITGEFSDVYGIRAKQIIILGDYMYYNDKDESRHLFKINLIDGSKEKIIDKPIHIFSMNSTHILYRKNANPTVYLMNLETKESKVIDINYDNYNGWIGLYENCILYKDKGSLYRSDIDGDDINTDNREVIQEDVYKFTLEGKYLYYIDNDSTLYVKDLTNNDTYFIMNDVSRINVDNNIMYYEGVDYIYIDEFIPEYYDKVN